MKVRVTRAQGYALGSAMAYLNERGISCVPDGDDSYFAEVSAEQVEKMRNSFPACPHAIQVLEGDPVIALRTDSERIDWLQSVLPGGNVRELIDFGMQDDSFDEDFAKALTELWNVRAVMQEIDEKAECGGILAVGSGK